MLVLPTPSGPDSVMTSPARAFRDNAAATSMRRAFVGKDHFAFARNREHDRRPFSFRQFQFDRSAMRFDELACQWQPETQRRLAADAGFDDPVEAVENPRQVFGSDARPIVADPDHGRLLVAARLQPDFSLRSL